MTSITLYPSNIFSNIKKKIKFKNEIRKNPQMSNFEKYNIIKKYFGLNSFYSFNIIEKNDQYHVNIINISLKIDNDKLETLFDDGYQNKFLEHIHLKFLEFNDVDKLVEYLNIHKKNIINDYFKISTTSIYDYHVSFDDQLIINITEDINTKKINQEKYQEMAQRKKERVMKDIPDDVKSRMQFEQFKMEKERIKKLEQKDKLFKRNLKLMRKDNRIDKQMVKLYTKIHWDYPLNDIPSPIEILNNEKKHRLYFYKYITKAMKEDNESQKMLLDNSYVEYMTYILKENNPII